MISSMVRFLLVSIVLIFAISIPLSSGLALSPKDAENSVVTDRLLVCGRVKKIIGKQKLVLKVRQKGCKGEKVVVFKRAKGALLPGEIVCFFSDKLPTCREKKIYTDKIFRFKR